MSKSSLEQIKRDSHGLRGEIIEGLKSGAAHFDEAELQLLKFHGTYQQDDRDLRTERRKQKLDKAWMFMVRSKMPGGRITAEQYLQHDRLAGKLGNGTIRLTTRQGIQLHGILKGSLKEAISTIKKSGLTTWGACGDVVRNTMGPASPIRDVAHEDVQKLAEELSDTFLARSSAYSEIWLNGEKVGAGDDSKPEEQEEEIYGNIYLPRKFKIGIAVPPRNDVDIFTQDVGMAPVLEEGKVAGYNLWIGGGFGMTHGKTNTRPHLAKPFAYVERDRVVEVVKAIVLVQREYGNRQDRKQARLKYLVANTSLGWFRNAVHHRVGEDCILHEPKEMVFDTVSDQLGWHEQGDGRLFRCVHVSQGRIENVEDGPQFRSGFRAVAEKVGAPMIATPNCNLIVADIDPGRKAEVDQILAQYGFPNDTAFTAAHQVAHACVALPTCGLALSESERVFGKLLNQIDDVLRDLGLEKEPLLVRMTGCPNGCARPYNADFAFVGRAPRKYAMYVGGSHRGDRLAGLHTKVVSFEEIPAVMRGILQDFTTNREPGETFTDYWGRTREAGPEPDADHFHVELAERAEKLAAAKK